jgi:glyoxylase I family protein
MGLAVDSRDDLLEWQAHFQTLGVVHTPVVAREYGSVLTFKDPDRIQFELFYLDPEFQAAATPH